MNPRKRLAAMYSAPTTKDTPRKIRCWPNDAISRLWWIVQLVEAIDFTVGIQSLWSELGPCFSLIGSCFLSLSLSLSLSRPGSLSQTHTYAYTYIERKRE